MGLFDGMNFDDPQTMALLNAAAQMAQQSGPSLRPTSLGQIMGGGWGAYSGSMAASKKQKQEDDAAKQAQMLHDLQIRSATGELADKDLSRQQAIAAQEWYRKYNQQGQQAQAAPSAVEAARRSMQTMFPANQPSAPAAPQPQQGQQSGDLYQERLAEAKAMRASGIPALIKQADDVEKQALAFREEYSTDPKQMLGPDGKLGNYQLAKYGSPARNVGLGVRPDMVATALGGTTRWDDKNAIAPGTTFKHTATIGEGLQGERLNFDKQQASMPVWNNEVSAFITRPTKEQPGGSMTQLAGYKKQEKPSIEYLKQAEAYQNMDDAITGYKKVLSSFGPTDFIMPAKRAEMGTAYQNTLLQAKEIYRLGVLNGPDKQILESIINSPLDLTKQFVPKLALLKQADDLQAIVKRGNDNLAKVNKQTMLPLNSQNGAAPAMTNARGWTLHTDANGNKAYVSPDGASFEEVKR